MNISILLMLTVKSCINIVARRDLSNQEYNFQYQGVELRKSNPENDRVLLDIEFLTTP